MTPNDLKAWRKAMFLTQAQAADLLGYKSASHYAKLENENSGQEIPHLLPLACAALYHKLKPWPRCR